MSAVAIMTTHVAFQTGIDPHSHIGAILGRFDYFLAVFFAFSAYLLWRGMDFHRGMLVTYFHRRFWRVVPAYWVYVVVALALVPEAFGASWVSVLSTYLLLKYICRKVFLVG